MHRLRTVVFIVSVLSFAGAVHAQGNGTGDPLGLIGLAAIQPFSSSGENFTIIEITSPVGFNTAPALHGVFFDAACNRDQSVSLPVTRNGLLLFSPGAIGVNYDGLAVIAGTVNGISLVPVNPIHVRGHWGSFANDHLRVIDPIAVAAAETNGLQTWSPLRTAANWGNPREGSEFHTTVYLVCPNEAVTNEVPAGTGFPAPPPTAFGATRGATSILGVIYDEDEVPLRNIQVPCICFTPLPVLSINSVYGDPGVSPVTGQFYTEIFSLQGRTFTGYRAIVVTGGVWPGGQGDDFGRLENGSALAYTTKAAASLAAR